MLIEEQIKKLLRTKAKIDLYKKIEVSLQAEVTALETDEDHKKLEAEHPGLIKEFCEELGGYCHQQVSELSYVKQTATPAHVETSVVTQVIEKPKVTFTPIPANDEPTDPLKFMMKYRHYESRRVTVETPNGPVGGVVRGLVTPYIIVQTDTGHDAKVFPKNIKLEGAV